MFQDIADEDIADSLLSKENDAPRIIAFKQGDELTGLYIVADGVQSNIDVKGGIMSAVVKLMACYYVFDLSYPRVHAYWLYSKSF